MIFGVLSLLVVLAIMGTVAKKQLQALSTSGVSTRISQMASAPPGGGVIGDRDGATFAIPGGMPGGVAADAGGLTVPQQAQNIQQQFKQSTERALQQGVDRNARSAP
jgi:hypothetical protein